MCEPLQGKSFHPEDQFGVEIDYIRHFNYHDVKSAVNFYKKYSYEFFKFKEDYPESAKEIENLWKYHDPNYSFNDWLFNYTFKDVIE